MGRFIEGADRTQATLLPEAIDDYVGEENPRPKADASKSRQAMLSSGKGISVQVLQLSSAT